MKTINSGNSKQNLHDVNVGENVKIYDYVNIYGCSIGDNSKIGAFTEIQKNAIIGKNCKISSHSFICTGVEIGNNCFIGHHVVFTNDKYPRAVNDSGIPETEDDWLPRLQKTTIGNNVSIGSNATILCGISVGDGAVIGAGSVITQSVGKGEVWIGNPARKLK